MHCRNQLAGRGVREQVSRTPAVVLAVAVSALVPAPVVRAQCPAQWLPGAGTNGEVLALMVHNDELIVGGDFTTAGGMSAGRIAGWDGSVWRPLGSGIAGTVYALSVYNGELIAGGAFTAAGGVAANRIARWDGSAWQALGVGVGNTVRALTVYNGELIAGGDFTTAGGAGANRIARWDGSAWRPLGSGLNLWVYALAVYQGELIAGGRFATAGGASVNYIARWDGSAWQPLGTGMDNYVYALAADDTGLLAGGSFTSAGGVSASRIARWNGSDWQSLGAGTSDIVYALTVYDSELIAGGFFTTAGGISARRVARWDGSDWQPLGTGMNGTVYALAPYGSELIAGGFFTTAGGQTSPNWARWREAVQPPTITQQPSPQSVVAGEPVSFSVEATGMEPLNYQWRKGGMPLSDGDNISGATTEMLTIDPAGVGDAGQYDVVVSSECGLVTSDAASLAVCEPVAVGQQPISQEASVGGSASLAVIATGTAPLTYQWRKGGVDLVDSGNISGATTATLTIDPVEAGDAGEYDVLIWNDCGSAASDHVSLTVTAACQGPAISQQPTSQSVTAGAPASFTVAAIGTAPLSFQWRKGGVDLLDDGRISGAKSATLTIKPTGMGDAGQYDVVVTNDCDSVTSNTVRLTILPVSAKIDIRPGSCPNQVVVNPNSQARIPVAIVGTASFNVRQVDTATITVGGTVLVTHVVGFQDVTSPAEDSDCACSEVGPDGIADLVVQFSLPELIEALDLEDAEDGALVPVTVQGMLLDDRPFEGTDCIQVKAMPNKKPPKK